MEEILKAMQSCKSNDSTCYSATKYLKNVNQDYNFGKGNTDESIMLCSCAGLFII
jgi:hypothetical protein